MAAQILERLHAALLPVTLAATIGLMGGPTMLSPAFGLAELNEQLPTKERNEEASAPKRFDQHRHLRLNQRPIGIVFILPALPCLDRAKPIVADSSHGHRLPNGLLAPLTC